MKCNFHKFNLHFHSHQYIYNIFGNLASYVENCLLFTMFLLRKSRGWIYRAVKDRERKGGSGKAVLATKFAAMPWRFTRRSVVVALRDSLSRLGVSSIDLYQLHWYALASLTQLEQTR